MATLTSKIVKEKGLDNVKHITADMLKGYDEIGVGAFEETKIETIEIPEGITAICSWAFARCKHLNSVRLPETLKVIGDFAFTYCYDLKNITIPNNVAVLGKGVFRTCHYLKSIKLPSNIFTLDTDVFLHCVSLETVELPTALTFIGEDAFENCRKLKSIKGYDNVKEIQTGAFYNTLSLRQKIYNDKGQLITYKIMNADMTCKCVQYTVGKTKTMKKKHKIKVCETGYHSCYSPFDCVTYYCGVYGTDVVMCKCIAEGDIDESETGDKIASRKITILKKFDSYAEAFDDYFAECGKIIS